MRTTVTLEGDVERLVREAMARGRRSFKQVLNEAVRRGLKGASEGVGTRFVVSARPMNIRAGFDPARLAEVDDDLEVGEFLRETNVLRSR